MPPSYWVAIDIATDGRETTWHSGVKAKVLSEGRRRSASEAVNRLHREPYKRGGKSGIRFRVIQERRHGEAKC